MASLTQRLVRRLTSSAWDNKVSSVIRMRNGCSESLVTGWKKSVSKSVAEEWAASKNLTMSPRQVYTKDVHFGSFIWDQLETLFPWFSSSNSKGEETTGEKEDAQAVDSADSMGEETTGEKQDAQAVDSANSKGEETTGEKQDAQAVDSANSKGEETTGEKEDAQAVDSADSMGEETTGEKQDAQAVDSADSQGHGEDEETGHKHEGGGTSVKVKQQLKLVKKMEEEEKTKKRMEEDDKMKKEEKIKPMKFVIKLEITPLED